MIKLFAYRVAPLALRPLAILIEGILPSGPVLLILSLPIAMIALLLSSIPVHLEYYKAQKNDEGFADRALEYSSGLGWIFLLAVAVLGAILHFPALSLGEAFAAIVCCTFLIEKLSDESSRALEFRKSFFYWFLVQVFRSGWVFVPLAVGYSGGRYEEAFVTTALITTILASLVFWRVNGMFVSLDLNGLRSIRKNLAYFFGSFLPASYRQVPRIVIVKAYPEQAHLFVALSQFGQGIGVLFNVKFQIPYRVMIARKTLAFQKIMEPVMNRILFCALVTAGLYLGVLIYKDLSGFSYYALVIYFLPVVVADALVFSVLSANLGYITWLSKPLEAMKFYLVAASIACVFLLILIWIDYLGKANLAGIPAASIVIGLIWVAMAKRVFFQTGSH